MCLTPYVSYHFILYHFHLLKLFSTYVLKRLICCFYVESFTAFLLLCLLHHFCLDSFLTFFSCVLQVSSCCIFYILLIPCILVPFVLFSHCSIFYNIFNFFLVTSFTLYLSSQNSSIVFILLHLYCHFHPVILHHFSPVISLPLFPLHAFYILTRLLHCFCFATSLCSCQLLLHYFHLIRSFISFSRCHGFYSLLCLKTHFHLAASFTRFCHIASFKVFLSFFIVLLLHCFHHLESFTLFLFPYFSCIFYVLKHLLHHFHLVIVRGFILSHLASFTFYILLSLMLKNTAGLCLSYSWDL